MNGVATLVLTGLEMLLRYAPGAFVQIKQVLAKENVSAEDIRHLRDQVLTDTYENIVTNSQLPKP